MSGTGGMDAARASLFAPGAVATSDAGLPAAPGGAVQLDGASVFYGEVVGLSRVSLSLAPGITGIVGPNGSGKSTLMKVVTGLMPPDEGSVRVLGEAPFTSHAVRCRIGFVPALECFHENLSGRRNLEATFMAQGLDAAAARERAGAALDLSGLTADGRRRYGAWSRGMRQRLKLGLTLAGDQDVVLLDEPFLGVDPPSRRQLRRLVLKLGEAGRTVLVSSHVLHEVEALTDRVGVLAHGRLLGFGKVGELLEALRDRHPHRVRLGAVEPRRVAAALMGRHHVREVKVIGEDAVEFVTARPDLAYRELGHLVGETGVAIHRVETLDAGLEAVFRHVTEAGSRRL
ncbi:MAG: ABC transporter ATP-binding protein [Candidatus Krumholzibacteriota bacterium]|nr:ABC transporter ATP-binding protein [Candidatus Krumholzibacteriota bacterium]